MWKRNVKGPEINGQLEVKMGSVGKVGIGRGKEVLIESQGGIRTEGRMKMIDQEGIEKRGVEVTVNRKEKMKGVKRKRRRVNMPIKIRKIKLIKRRKKMMELK